jgi:hypothetical protein
MATDPKIQLKLTLEEINKLQEDYNELILDEKKNHEEINKNLERQAEITKEQVERNKLLRAHNEEIFELMEKGLDSGARWNKLVKERNKLLESTVIMTADEMENEEEALRLLSERVKRQKKYNETVGVGKKAMSDLLASIGINDEWDESFLGKAEAAINRGDLRGHLGEIADEMSELPKKLGGSMMMKSWRETLKLAAAQDTATSALSKATGAGNKYDGAIQDVYLSNRRFGASFEDAGEAIGSMYSKVPAFDDFSQGTRDGLMETTVLLDKLGVSTDTTAGIITHMTTTMGMTGDQALDTTRGLHKLSGAGMNLQKVYADYLKVSDKLAYYSGPKSIEVFEKLSNVAKATASDVGELISIAEGFDTFDQAAESAGQFNALLGGNFIDPVALVQMEDMGDRINYIVGLKDKTGVMWETLSRYERLSLAKSLNMDVDQLGKLWTMSTSELGKYNEEQETLKQRADASLSVQEKWNSIQQTFAITMKPVIDLLADLSEWYLAADQKVQGLTAGVAGLTIGMAAFGGPIIKVGTFLVTWAAQAAGMATGNAAITATSTPAAGGISMIGRASGAAAPGVASLAASLVGLSAPILATGAAFALAGVGMFAFGNGVATIFDSITEDKVGALSELFLSIGLFAPMSVVAVPATIAITTALAGMSAVIATFDEKKLANIAELTSNFKNLKKNDMEVYTRAIRETTNLYKVAGDSKGKDPVSAIKPSLKTGSSSRNENSSQTMKAPFVIKLDERELGNFVVEIVNGEVNVLSRD